jgi:putative hemolysin
LDTGPYPSSIDTTLYIAAVFVMFSAALTLIKTTFSIINSNFDAGRDTAPHLMAIEGLWRRSGFLEAISTGRFICNNTASILVFFFLHPRIQPLVATNFMSISICIILTWFLIYTPAMFIPNVVASYRPYSISKLALFLMKSIGWLFFFPGSISRFCSKQLLQVLGHDERISFLRDEQKAALDSDSNSSHSDHSLEEDEKEMIMNIFDFGETPVKEIMTPRVNMVALEIDTPLEKTLQLINEERHSRIPVYRENPDQIIGVLYNRDLLHWYSEHEPEEFHLSKVLKPAFFVTHDRKIDDLMRELRKTRNQMAVVVDEYGGTAGVVTLEDILEEIVGEIHDEDDSPEDNLIQQQADGSYIINPVISIWDLQDELHFQLSEEETQGVDSLSGLIQKMHGKIPMPGTKLSVANYTINVLKINGQRIERVHLQTAT